MGLAGTKPPGQGPAKPSRFFVRYLALETSSRLFPGGTRGRPSRPVPPPTDICNILCTECVDIKKGADTGPKVAPSSFRLVGAKNKCARKPQDRRSLPMPYPMYPPPMTFCGLGRSPQNDPAGLNPCQTASRLAKRSQALRGRNLIGCPLSDKGQPGRRCADDASGLWRLLSSEAFVFFPHWTPEQCLRKSRGQG